MTTTSSAGVPAAANARRISSSFTSLYGRFRSVTVLGSWAYARPPPPPPLLLPPLPLPPRQPSEAAAAA
jgi:hypothetical protein